jgi:predicted MFS family arabinose efflux permease
MLMLVAAIFMLARFSESFLCVYARKTFDLPLENIPLVTMTYNATWCLTVYPVGRMADRINRYWFLIIGILFLVLADMVLANASSLTMLWIGIGLWGVQLAITQNIFLSLAGVISQHFGQSRMFLASGVIAVFSLLVLIVIMGYKNKK